MTSEPHSNNRALRSGEKKLDSNTILNRIQWSFHNSQEETCWIFDGVDSQLAEKVACELEKGDMETRGRRFTYDASLKELKIVLMSNHIHDCHQSWMFKEVFSKMVAAGYLTSDEVEGIHVSIGTKPDFCLFTNSTNLPTVVIESGWSESRLVLERDRNLWLQGGQGTVQIVMIIKWTKDPGQLVSGDISVFDLDPVGNIRQLQTEQIFPRPINGEAQAIHMTRSQLYGPTPLPVGRNGTDGWQFSLDALRDQAKRGIQQEGYTPA